MKFTPEVRSTILNWLRGGCFRYQACAAAGISRQTLAEWAATALKDPKGEHADFIEQMQIVEDAARAKLAAINNALATGTELIQGDAVKNPIRLEAVNLKALHFQMERGGDRSWGEVQRVEVTGKDGEPLRTGEPTPERAAALVRTAFGEHARRPLLDDDEIPVAGGREA